MEPTTPSPAAAPAPASAPAGSWPREPRRLDAGRGTSWWGEGWRIFTAAPVPWLVIAILLIVINVALGFIPVVGSIASTVLGPIFVGGLLLGCHALAAGRPLEITHLFAAFQSDRLVPLAILGAIVLAFGIVVGLAFFVVMFGTAGTAMLSGAMNPSAGGMWAAMAGMGVGMAIGGLLGLVAGLAFFLAWWFAPALVTLNRAPPVEALQASFRASVANLGAIVVFVLIFVVLAIVASIPFMLGWLVLAPVAAGAAYASWREVYGE